MRLFGRTGTKTLAHPWERQTQDHCRVLAWSPAPFKDIDKRHHALIKELAKTFVQIVESRGLFGCLRDNEALSYWQGAATALKYAGLETLSEDVAKIGAVEIAPRGFQAISEIALF